MNSSRKNAIKIMAVLLISASIFLVPFETLGVPLNEIQVRVVALFAMAALLMPIMAAVGGGMLAAGTINGSACIGLLASVALAASPAMALPISTPPNALAYATGMISTRQMAIPGVIIGIVGLIITIGMCYMLGAVGFFA